MFTVELTEAEIGIIVEALADIGDVVIPDENLNVQTLIDKLLDEVFAK